MPSTRWVLFLVVGVCLSVPAHAGEAAADLQESEVPPPAELIAPAVQATPAAPLSGEAADLWQGQADGALTKAVDGISGGASLSCNPPPGCPTPDLFCSCIANGYPEWVCSFYGC